MPLYVHNMNEVMAEDDSPLPANTPSTGVASHTRVIGCGNRVLEIIEKHKRDIQSRMANRADTFRGILEKELEGRSIRKNGRSNPQDHHWLHAHDSSVPLTRVPRNTSGHSHSHSHAHSQISSAVENVAVPAQAQPTSSIPPKKVRHSAEAKIINLHEALASPKPRPVEHNVPLISSEEYFDIPSTSKEMSRGHTKPEKESARKTSLRTSSKDNVNGSKRVTLLPPLKGLSEKDKHQPQFPAAGSTTGAYQEGCTWDPYHDPCFDDYNANSKSDTVAHKKRANHPPDFPVSQEEIRKSLRGFDMDDEDDYYAQISSGNRRHTSKTRNTSDDASSTSSDSSGEEEFRSDGKRIGGRKMSSNNGTTSSATVSKSSRNSTSTTVAVAPWGSVLGGIWDRTWEFLLLLAVILLILGLCVVSMDHNKSWQWLMGKDNQEEKVMPRRFSKYRGPVM